MLSRNLSLIERLGLLGLRCDEVPRDHLSSVLTALASFPMYMVANVSAWMTGRDHRIPLTDLPGVAVIREAFVIGEVEARGEMSREHRHVLGSLLSTPKLSDRVIYEFALETLNQALEEVEPAVADVIRTGVARTIVAVARASGEGFLGLGPKVSPEERACISHIATTLHLGDTPAAAEALARIDG